MIDLTRLGVYMQQELQRGRVRRISIGSEYLTHTLVIGDY